MERPDASASYQSFTRWTVGDATGVAAIILGVLTAYTRTMYPGLMGSGDTAKFQYLGRVLGTAHNPGYPFYIVLSHFFSYLPVGTLAYRMNLLSVVAAIAAAVLMFRLARRLGSGLVAAAIALAFAWGRLFWSVSLRAEVYSVAAALQIAILLFLTRWGQQRQTRDFYLAMAFIAVAVGHHLTVVMMLPAVLAFILLIDARWFLKPRPLATVSGFALLGVSQYLFIIVRTRQHAAAVESHAENLRELFDVVRGRQFAELVLGDPLGTILHARLFQLLVSLAGELGTLALIGALAGAILLARRSRPSFVLFLGAAAGTFAFALLYTVPDYEGFLIPVAVCLWALASIGLSWAIDICARALRLPVAATACLALLLPAWALTTNYRASDHSRRTYEIDYFQSLFDGLPSSSVILREQYAVDQMVQYELLGAREQRGRDIKVLSVDEAPLIRDLARRGYQINAFDKARQRLSAVGFHFEPVQLTRPNGERIPMEYLPLFRLRSMDTCFEMGNLGWIDVTSAFASGRAHFRIDNYRPFDASVTIVAATRAGHAPEIMGHAGVGVPRVKRTHPTGAGAAEEIPALQPYLSGAAPALQNGSDLWRVETHINDQGHDASFHVDLGGEPRVVFARAQVDQNTPRRATICTDPLEASESFAHEDPKAFTISMGNGGEPFIVSGWNDPEQDSSGRVYRWTSSPDAVLILRLDHALPLHLSLNLMPLTRPKPAMAAVALAVNGTALDGQALISGWHSYEWDVPASSWRSGLNEIVIHSPAVVKPIEAGLGQDARPLGLAVSHLDLSRPPR